VLDSGAEGSRVQIAVATLSGNSLRQTVHSHRASVHQAAKLVAALLRVARVTAGPAESNGSLPPGLTHVTCRLTAKNQGPDLQNILRQSYDYLRIMRKLRSTYDGRLIYKTSYEGRKAFLRYDSLAKL